MRKLYFGLFLLPILALVGCTGSGNSGGTGGPGASNPTNTTSHGMPPDTFKLNAPASESVKQNDVKQFKISIERGTDFKEDVSLKFDNLPKGVTVEPSDVSIKSSANDAGITFKASDSADVGEFKVKIIGHPSKGKDVEVPVTLTVKAK